MSDTDELEPEQRIDETRTWPDLAISLYDRLTGRGAEITYEFQEMQVDVPSKAGPDPEHARWQSPRASARTEPPP